MVTGFKFIILFFLFSCLSFAQEVTVKAYTDTTDYLIGDHIKYTIQVISDKDVQILATGFKDSIANVDVPAIDEPVVEEKDDKKITFFKFTLSRFDSADVTIPPVPVYYRTGKDAEVYKLPMITSEHAAKDPSIKTELSNSVIFTVHSIKVNVQEDIKDVKEPVTLPLDWKIIALWILISLIILALIYYFYRKYQKNKGTKPIRRIVLPPHIIALDSLKNLESKKLWQEGKVKEYHSEITEIIRRYFEDRFKLPALELTTSEAMFHLRSTPGAENIIDTTYNFLTNADLVKFAKYTPMNSVNEEMMKQAYEIVNATIPEKVLEPAVEETDV